jgi:uncharacterized linocin/CFP29 family protein
LLSVTGPLGAGSQTVGSEQFIGITEGRVGLLGDESSSVKASARSSGVVPILFKDFVLHWRDVEEARLNQSPLPASHAAAAAAFLSFEEDKLLLFGDRAVNCTGLASAEGRARFKGLGWNKPARAFSNFTMMTDHLRRLGHNGPFAAVVHPGIYSEMHRVVDGSDLLEIAHVKSLVTAGIFRSSLLAPGSGLIVAREKQNAELVIAIDTSVAFLGARLMNLPFRVLKAVYLRIHRGDAICTFEV